jgi:ubiquinone/menaquinone biosynthesis C-methylase UbiE
MDSPFDSQAVTYEQRVGLPEGIDHAVAQAVLKLAAVQPAEVVLEVGAGTGQIGQWFVQKSVRYVGFDLSRGMLQRFQQRLASPGAPSVLLLANGEQRWPIREGTVRVIFSSRALHRLPLAHVVAETLRVAHPQGAWLLVGRIQCAPQSLPVQMQQQLQRLLRHNGFQPRAGERHQEELLASYQQHGGEALAPLVVARWRVTSTPAAALAAWQGKPGLGGVNLSAHAQRTILRALSLWAETTFEDLERAVESEVVYTLQGVKLAFR